MMTIKMFRNYIMGILAASIVCVYLAGCEFDPLADGASGSANCDTCHASPSNYEMPFSVDGDLSLGEGAHLSHLEATIYGNPVSCGECHLVPVSLDHIDDLPAEVVFGSLARTEGARPVWDREARVCSNVYCHGATLSGGSNTTPEWTVVDGSQVACGSCHGIPPKDDRHPNVTECGGCHGAVYSNGQWINPGLHIDGDIEDR